MKTMVYIDGYNLYYGSLRKTAHKWLDIHRLFSSHILNSESKLLRVNYYTAPVLGKMCDDPDSPKRQRTYLQALRKLYPNKIAIIEGKMIAMKKKCRNLNPPPEIVTIQNFEEKKSDVSIAIDMLTDVLCQKCDHIVLCSNDSDFEPALARIKEISPNTRIGLVSPVRSNDSRHVSKDLLKYANWHKFIKDAHLEIAQLPCKIPYTSIKRPKEWGECSAQS